MRMGGAADALAKLNTLNNLKVTEDMILLLRVASLFKFKPCQATT